MQLFLIYLFLACSTCFGHFPCPSSGAHNCIYIFGYCEPILLLAGIMQVTYLYTNNSWTKSLIFYNDEHMAVFLNLWVAKQFWVGREAILSGSRGNSEWVAKQFWVGREAILSGSRRKFINLFIIKSHYYDTCIKSNRYFFNAITCSNTVAMLASVAFYKIDTAHRMPRLPASHWKKKSDQPNKIIVFRQSCRTVGKIFSIWGIPRKTRKTT
jgi:hypothetical protein